MAVVLIIRDAVEDVAGSNMEVLADVFQSREVEVEKICRN